MHDVYYHEHGKHVVPLESPRANTRNFGGEGGETRAYTFTKLESRTLTPERLAAQFSAAGFVAVTPRTIGARKPT